MGKGIIAGAMPEDPEDESMESGDEETQEHASGKEPPDEAMQPEADEGPSPESDPAFRDALKFAMTALYQNGAAKKIAEAITSATDKVTAIANTAYDIVSITDEKTQGSVPEELLAVLGAHVLQEVTDICEAAGQGCAPADVAEAFKRMVLRFVEEQGFDTAQLKQAMDQVDPNEIVKAAQSGEPAEMEDE